MFDDDAADIDDVLNSMAESLIEGQAFYKVPQLPDPEPSPLKAVKPSKDVFYRTLPLYTKNPPANIIQRRCSCMYLCTGSIATIKCISCASMDVKGVGYFCQVCFDARHPWYRVPHVSVNIEEDEDINHNRKNANFKIEMLRCEHEGRDLLNRIDKQKQKLDNIGDDAHFDDTLRTAGRSAMNVENKLRILRRKLRVDIRVRDKEYKTFIDDKNKRNEKDQMDNIYAIKSISTLSKHKLTREQYIQQQLLKPIDLPVNIDEAVAIIQKYFRGWLMRKLISLLYCSKIITRIYDINYNKYYYYNKKSGKSMWKPPNFVLNEHMQFIADNENDEDNNINANFRNNVNLRVNTNHKNHKNMNVNNKKNQITNSIKNKIPYWCCKLIRLHKRRKRKVVTDIYKAGIVIQQFLKCILARKKVIEIANTQYVRIWDNDTYCYYYFNKMNKTSNWRKPVGIYLYNSIEPPDG